MFTPSLSEIMARNIEARLTQDTIPPQRQNTVMETTTSQVEDVSEVASELTPILPFRQNAEVPNDWVPPTTR